MDIQQAHLQLHAGMKLSPDHRDAIRAEIMRSRLQSLQAPDKRIHISEETDRFPEGDNPENQ
jgi:protein arginine kinase